MYFGIAKLIFSLFGIFCRRRVTSFGLLASSRMTFLGFVTSKNTLLVTSQKYKVFVQMYVAFFNMLYTLVYCEKSAIRILIYIQGNSEP